MCTREDTWARQAQWGRREHWPRGRALQRAPLVSALLTAQMGSLDSGAGRADRGQLSLALPDLPVSSSLLPGRSPCCLE